MHSKNLTAVTARNAPIGWHGDGGGLYLQCSPAADGSISRSWVFRYRTNGRERWMGLGPLRDVSLAEARDKAAAQRKLRIEGIDPIEARQAQRTAANLEATKRTTFAECIETYLAFKSPEWKNDKHAAQWATTLRIYAKPLHDMSPSDIDLAYVVKTLEPHWYRVPETASRTRQRIEAVLDHWAAKNSIHDYVNPASWERVKHVLPAKEKLKREKAQKDGGDGHYRALPYAEIPAFMAELRKRDSLSAKALEFTILTAARTGEVIGAEWSEIDWEAKTWTAPASRMKAGKEHRVPLSERALTILREVPRQGARIFPLSNMAMLELIKGMRPGLTVHGFRSSFMDWCHECTNHPKVVIDMALAHAIGDKVEASYRRGDLFTRRAKLMNSWTQYCGKPFTDSAVIPLRRESR
jgi:integrase